MTTTIVLTPRKTVGCYYQDATGRSWATVTGCNSECLICGATLHQGYVLSARDTPDGHERYACATHIRVRRTRRTPAAPGARA